MRGERDLDFRLDGFEVLFVIDTIAQCMTEDAQRSLSRIAHLRTNLRQGHWEVYVSKEAETE